MSSEPGREGEMDYTHCQLLLPNYQTPHVTLTSHVRRILVEDPATNMIFSGAAGSVSMGGGGGEGRATHTCTQHNYNE